MTKHSGIYTFDYKGKHHECPRCGGPTIIRKETTTGNGRWHTTYDSRGLCNKCHLRAREINKVDRPKTEKIILENLNEYDKSLYRQMIGWNENHYNIKRYQKNFHPFIWLEWKIVMNEKECWCCGNTKATQVEVDYRHRICQSCNHLKAHRDVKSFEYMIISAHKMSYEDFSKKFRMSRKICYSEESYIKLRNIIGPHLGLTTSAGLSQTQLAV